ncbi:sensor domain-containing diguanylate cyclase [Pectobacterium odoriferum]|uniref:sensor domain-containing diguanylate cyclase n=1 Tax=Pectobacterium odoriferum TaxID=78398 RepID=UPI000CD13EBF|nr:sensor domain-containing diguanylate cyclase [Pectobacterium odoriferum]POE03336.1 diguanylate cyclase [Pectobacterium odoriferum]POE06742.1 diguanylate cyclase [Pectobacterium odoriferum]
MTDNLLSHLSNTLRSEASFEGLVRQLLVMLELVTDLESTYLTQVDTEAGFQNILFAHNTKTLNIPEGISVPWHDTLCKRALDEGQSYTPNVAECWGDSEAAQALGIMTYASTPVRMEDGQLYGTLCAASSDHKPLTTKGEQILSLFAQLIAQQVQKEWLVQQLTAANAALHEYSYTDSLTGLLNRRGVFYSLEAMFSQAKNDHQQVLIVFIDLDGFKKINDQFGHEAGDIFLQEVGQRLLMWGNPGDVVGRLGGDEFVFARMVNVALGENERVIASFRDDITPLLQGSYSLGKASLLGTVNIEYLGASIGIVTADPSVDEPDGVIRRADAAMYANKVMRKKDQTRAFDVITAQP